MAGGPGPGHPRQQGGVQQEGGAGQRQADTLAHLQHDSFMIVREYRPTTWAFLLGPAGGNFILFLLLKATHKKILLATLNTLLG